jgi:hypothetical protein
MKGSFGDWVLSTALAAETGESVLHLVCFDPRSTRHTRRLHSTFPLLKVAHELREFWMRPTLDQHKLYPLSVEFNEMSSTLPIPIETLP